MKNVQPTEREKERSRLSCFWQEAFNDLTDLKLDVQAAIKEIYATYIFFEKENINTMDMNGEMLLTILSSMAQQEVESLSQNVKMGLKMKMKRGELIGFNGCLGYDYHPEDKTLTVNEEEAEIVRLFE